eukprot:4777903-Alexandrium_andersonii.AAC.1
MAYGHSLRMLPKCQRGARHSRTQQTPGTASFVAVFSHAHTCEQAANSPDAMNSPDTTNTGHNEQTGTVNTGL